MQPWTIDELMHLTRDELCWLAADLEWTLPAFEAGTAARHTILASLDSIRRTMTRRGLHH
ncbi:hypothetical protein NLM33_40595 [Bradyrhizobium sp. CCGUVB1N3]|uniref:hypothetical protein n=1 Tax=Bradyrhizobium sp. CCGUVB1N3 TaxID=2949629 RepID=UPI0020B4218E|nr:hypothetical protein [Bradyrhizobium sp. CCGUVB1N3]MCP3476512.1 hypothetical protein [Bradyrhizobium sp. CCGUVB1N3]